MYSIGHLLIAPLLIAAATSAATAQSCPTSDTWPATGGDGIRYGRAVDIDPSFLAIGDYSANTYTGAVFVHEWDGGTWSEPQVLTGTATYEEFGTSVCLSDGWIALSAPSYNNGAIDLYHHDGTDWNYEDSYETPAGYELRHMSLSYPWLAVAELADSGAVMRIHLLQHDVGSNTWPVSDTLIMPADSGYTAFISLDQNYLAIGLPAADLGANVNCGVVHTYKLVGGVWTALAYSTMNEPGGEYGQYVQLDSTTQTVAFSQHGSYATEFDDSILSIHKYNGLTWIPEPISGSMPWSVIDSQISNIALDGDDLVVVLWSTELYNFSTHHLQRSEGMWYYQGEITPADAVTNEPRYVAAMNNGMIAMDGGTSETERVVWALPAEDCDGSGRSDACEVLIPEADGNGDGILDRCMCPGDLDFNSHRDGNDIILFLGLWASSSPAGDLNVDGAVNVLDLLIVLEQWGACP